ncbi:MAG: glycosyltransferase [Nanoarchaeota archaeon]|nr:glycosyltransferase [Nanoarchaeota archaeon]
MIKKIIIGSHATEIPTRCGIATYTAHLTNEMIKHPRVAGLQINALNYGNQKYVPEREQYKWRETNIKNPNIDVAGLLDDIERARDYWAEGGMERVEVISHEYGIFRDGKGKDFLVPLLKGLNQRKITSVFIPHTILLGPEKHDPDYRQIMEEAVQFPNHIFALTPEAIEMLEGPYNAPRINVSYVPHGINDVKNDDRFKNRLPRPKIKSKFGIKQETDVYVSGGFFSKGKLIDHAIKAFAINRKKGYENFQYYIIGLEKDKEWKDYCFNLAKSLGLNPLSLGNGDDGGGLEQLIKHDLNPHKIIFFNTYLNDGESYDSKVMAKAIITVNESESQISSGEIARALEAKRVPISYASPIVRDMAREGVGFSVEPKNIEKLAETIYFYAKDGNQKELELASAKIGSKAIWEKSTRDMIDIITTIVDNDEEDLAESRTILEDK